MLIRIVGNPADSEVLHSRTLSALEDLGLLGQTEVECVNTPEYRELLKIQTLPALCIEEPSINFQDMIFEGVIPEKVELVSLLMSIFGIEDKKGGCGTCSTGGCSTCSTCSS